MSVEINKLTSPGKSGGIGVRCVSTTTRLSLSVEMSRLTRDRTAEPISQDQIFKREREKREMIIFLVYLTKSRIGNLTRFIYNYLRSEQAFGIS